MERTAAPPKEFVDIVIGYHHILLFTVAFGTLVFGLGYFVGYSRAGDEPSVSIAESASAPASPRTTQTSVLVPSSARLAEPVGLIPTDAAENELEGRPTVSGAGVGAAPEEFFREAAPGQTGRNVTPGRGPSTEPPAPVAAKPVARQPAASTDTVAEPESSAVEPTTELDAPPSSAVAAEAEGNIYLQVSSFESPEQALVLMRELSASGFRTALDDRLVAGKQTVLVGPFGTMQTAMQEAKKLKAEDREAWPIRR